MLIAFLPAAILGVGLHSVITGVFFHSLTLISAALLFNFGTSAIRGFALTLTIGLLANVFTAYFVSRTMFEATLTGRNVQKLSI